MFLLQLAMFVCGVIVHIHFVRELEVMAHNVHLRESSQFAMDMPVASKIRGYEVCRLTTPACSDRGVVCAWMEKTQAHVLNSQNPRSDQGRHDRAPPPPVASKPRKRIFATPFSYMISNSMHITCIVEGELRLRQKSSFKVTFWQFWSSQVRLFFQKLQTGTL